LIIKLYIIRGVARDKSTYGHHYSRGVRGHAPSEIFDILYRRSVCQEENIFVFKCKLPTQKIMVQRAIWHYLKQLVLLQRQFWKRCI